MRVLRVYHAALEPGHEQRDAALGRAGLDLTLLAPAQWPGGTAHREDVITLPILRPGDVNRHTYADAARVAKIAQKHDVDLVDLHEEPFSAVTHQLLHAFPSSLPVVTYTAQNIDKRWPPPFHQWQQQAFARIGGIYPCSRQAASVARGAGFTRLITPLPLGVDPDIYFPGAQAHDDAEFTLGLVGRLVPEKGIADAIAVLRDLNKERKTRLIIVGEGSETVTALHLAARYGVKDQLTLSGWEAPGALADLYRSMHVVLVPSTATRTWVEQFGRVVTEGRACGAVAVGYASGSLPEVIGTTGITVPEGDVAALGAACTGLAADADRWETLRAEGIIDTTTWDDVAAEQAAFYQQVIDGTTHARVAKRPAAVAEFCPPAVIAGGGRPFALPVLREDTSLSRTLATTIDTGARARIDAGERAVERLLLAAVRLPEDASFATACDAASKLSSTDLVLARARDHGVLPLLAGRLAADAADPWPDLAAAIREPFLGHVGQTMVLQAETASLATALADIPYALVKGPVLAGHAYGNLERRAFADLDLVVNRADVVAAAEAVGATGITAAGVDAAAARGAGQVSGTLPHGTSLDLHWELINDPLVRRDFAFATAPALARRRTVSLEGQPVSTLDATDTLLHLASHTAVSGGHRLLWYVDLDRTIRVDGIAASEVLARARAAGLSTTLAVLLARCVRQLGTPVPAGLIGSLLADGSLAWAALGRALDLAVPLSSSPDRPAHGQVYFRSTRQSFPLSLRALRALTAEVRHTR